MQDDTSFFGDIGGALGTALRHIVEAVSYVWHNFFGAIDDFFKGLTTSLGINPSFFSLALLVIGLLFLYGALRALLRGAIIGGAIRLALGALLLSWLIH